MKINFKKRLKLEIYNQLPLDIKKEYIKRCYNDPQLKVRMERTPEELAEGCIYFINMFCEIYNKNKAKYEPFILYPAQEDYIRDYFIHKKIIVNKSRQCGFTWVTCGILVYSFLFMDGEQSLVLSKTGTDAVEVMGRIKSIINRLPDFIRPLESDYKRNTKNEIELKDKRDANGKIITPSFIVSKCTSNSSGRGGNYTNILWDEAAHTDNKVDCAALYNSLYPSLGVNGKFVINSTPNGLGNFYAEKYLEAEDGGNDLYIYKFHWAFDPERCQKYFDYFETKRKQWRKEGKSYVPTPEDLDYGLLREEDWYIQTRASGLSEDAFNQEYELTFQNSGSPAFDLMLLKRNYEEDVNNAVILEKRFNNKCLIYERPKPKTFYIATLDTAENKGRDRTVLMIFDRKFNQVAEYVDNQTNLNLFLTNTLSLLKEYNFAFLIFELNNVSGGFTQKFFETERYFNCYVDEEELENRPGLRTKKSNKNYHILELRGLLNRKEIKIKSIETYKELTTYTSINGGFSAPQGFHDDRVMALSFLVPIMEDARGWTTNVLCV